MKKILIILLLSCGKNSVVTSVQTTNTLTDLMTKTYPVNDGDSYFLIMGGGYDPYGSNLALELNMAILDDTLSFYNHQNENIYRLFGGGNNSFVLDVIEQFREKDFADYIYMDYLKSNGETTSNRIKKLRHNNLQNLLGGNNEYDFNEQIKNITTKSNNRDKFRFYYTGHGNHSADYKNNYLAVLGDENKGELTVKEVVAALDKFDTDTQVQFVTVSCYGGGFADIIYVDGDRTKGFNNYNRCGFFPTDRKTPAAGCSDDINFREEYTPYFVEAYLGVNKHGQKIDADYNQDGVISASEAHAYVIIYENSYNDLPLSTSDSLLDDFYEDRYGGNIEAEAIKDLKSHTWDNMYTHMNLEERIIVDSLQRQLNEFWPENIGNLYQLLVDISGNIQQFNNQQPVTAHDAFLQNLVLSQDVKGRYPHLGSNYDLEYKVNGEVLSKETMIDELYKFIRNQDGYEEANQSYLAFMKDLYSNNNINKVKRLIELISRKLIELKLMNSGKTEWISKYLDLKKCEAASFF